MRLAANTVLLFFLSLSGLLAQSSNHTNIWYFGVNAGLDFNLIPPVPLLDGALDTNEGCASICDASGQLLIYTDGVTIWNKNNQVIPGAVDLGGHISTTQSAVIVPLPDSPNLLYVFSVGEGGGGEVRYAIVDMSLMGGLGGLVSANNIILDGSTEKICIIPHCNNKAYWVIAHESKNAKFAVWELTPDGLSEIPTITTIGSIHEINMFSIGYMKSSQDGSKLAVAVCGGNFFEIFDFDTGTGEISNPLKLTNSSFNYPYGLEFSPNGKYLYLGVHWPLPIFQVDISLPTSQEIQNSLQIVGTNTNGTLGAFQYAPDGKIYIAKHGSEYLSLIQNPDEPGLACGFIEDAVYLGGRKAALGLPNFVPRLVPEDTVEIALSASIDTCAGTAVLTAETNIPEDSVSIAWYFNGDVIPNQNNSSLLIGASGEYWLELLAITGCQAAPFSYFEDIQLVIPPLLAIQELEMVHSSCGETNGSITVHGQNGTAPLQYSLDGFTFQASNLFEDLPSGAYDVYVRDAAGCLAVGNTEIQPSGIPSIGVVQLVPAGCQSDNAQIEVLGVDGMAPYLYSIDGVHFQSQGIFSGLAPGTYTLRLVDAAGCESETTASLLQRDCSLYIPNAFSPNADGVNDRFQVFSKNGMDGVVVQYLIFDRWGELVCEARDFPIGSAQHWWDGTFHGKKMGPGVFAYFMEVQWVNGGREVFEGGIAIIE